MGRHPRRPRAPLPVRDVRERPRRARPDRGLRAGTRPGPAGPPRRARRSLRMTILAPDPEAIDDAGPRWHTVCRLDALIAHRGVAVLIDGQAIALFRLHDDQVRAIANVDPYAGASVLARG